MNDTLKDDPLYVDFLQILRRSTDLLTDDPVREEVFSVEHLERYAAYLAGKFTVSSTLKGGRSIFPDLKKNGRKLLDAYLRLTEVIRDKEVASPAAEWLVDNFHIVEDQVREIKQDLPKDYYDELPKLATGELEGYPRVYGIALAIIAHTDSHLDADVLKRFLHSYQQGAPLTIGELWATAITLRIALVEHLTPLALRIVTARQKRAEADAFADRLLQSAAVPDTSPEDIGRMFIVGVGEPGQFDRAFIVQLTQRLRDQDPDLLSAFDWLEKQLDRHHHTNIQAVIQLEHHRQVTAQTTVSNIITSMRLLSSLDWRKFIESVSLVDPILNQDPSGAYSKMDFATRDRYRHVVERLAKRSKQSELKVAEHLIEVAGKPQGLDGHPESPKRSHVGFYLIGDGRFNFERQIGYRPRLKERVSRWVARHPALIYLGSLSLLALLLCASIFAYFKYRGGENIPALFFTFFALIPASEFALSIVNHVLTRLLKPKQLPKIDMEAGIPPEATTMVVIPTFLSNESVIRNLLKKLQVHFLSNRDPYIYFALLGDFKDADKETLPEDATLLKFAQRQIAELNRKYGDADNQRFFLFHRKRIFNSCEEKWIGYERKRGKIHEFNRLLRGATDTSFVGSSADPAFLAKIQYVITLDSDTELPRGAAHQLVGMALHPLNRPEFDAENGRVISGYGILQPRISVALSSANRTRFTHIFSSARGLDPYTTACSDVYQDLFGEGSYTGKGLYVVDAFEAALANRVPENTVLSHDLFESCFARSALVTDVELFDDYPDDYKNYSKRIHRWIRGDWQLVPWLFPRVPTSGPQWVPNQLSLIARWKILDNLRRSLVPSAVILWLWLGWVFLPGSPFFWTLLIGILFAFPIYATATSSLFHKRLGVSRGRHVSHRWTESLLQLRQTLVLITFLPDQAWNQTDAILRTLYRKLVSHKKLLEWTTFAAAQNDRRKGHSGWITLGPGPVLSIFTAMTLFVWRPDALGAAAPLLIAWLANPFLKMWIRKKRKRRVRALDTSEVTTFRLYARRTWHFFETFVTKEDKFLVPDNFQEDPEPVVAHRTSPTNIGVQLLSLSSAYDFGYVGRLEFLEHTERIFQSVARLERLHGHFFNWYDTQTLEPLRPQYISTVDSGNLAGHLLAFKQSLFELIDNRKINPKAKEGLTDTLALLKENAFRSDSLKSFRSTIESILDFVSSSRWNSEAEFGNFLNTLLSRLAEVPAGLWLDAAIHQATEFKRDLSPEHEADKIRLRIEALIHLCDEIVLGMDFKFLFDEQRKIFVIGYNVVDHKNDNSYYDLLASESRLASFVAIAKGDIPQEHWFRLGRRLTAVKGGGRALISWTGTMFEYLMPLLVTRNFGETLLDQTCRSIVAHQIDYGKKKRVPWGVSESEYNMRDLQFMFQYRAFGVPGLGLKRGLSDDLVISPYSTMLAVMIDPLAALSNLRNLEEMGMLSCYGFYESIDYTPERLKKNRKYFILRSFMAHHQGMSLISMNNLLHENGMQRRFHSEPLVQATQLLLQERIPTDMLLYRSRAQEVHSERTSVFPHWNPRTYADVSLPMPRTQLLSNGCYSVMLTTTGSGYSRCASLEISRWREDVTRDHWGQFFYIRNRATHSVWSPGYQPTTMMPEKYEATFAEDKVEFWREDGQIATHTEIIVSPEEDVEIRRISLTNNSLDAQEFEVTSFMETVLAPLKSDTAHPAFNNLFVQTEFVPEECALLATRRRRSEKEEHIFGFHVLVVEGDVVGSVQYETDRAAFLGRGRNPSDALVIIEDRPLSNTVGAVLDPLFSLRHSIRIPAGETARISFATGLTHSREEALRLVDKYHDIHIFDRAAELAWTASRVQLRHLNIDSHQTHTFQRLASRVIYSDPFLRPRSQNLAMNFKAQAGLWAYGISGDRPIILALINNEQDMGMVRELIHGHEYLRLKGLAIDLVLLNEFAPSYLKTVEEELQRQIRMIGSQALLDKPGGIFIRNANIIPQEDIVLLKAVSRVVLNCSKGTLREQLNRHPTEDHLPDKFIPTVSQRQYPAIQPVIPPLEFFNGLGGFAEGGREYMIVLKEGNSTPAPWINVISNSQDFGFIVSESGGGCTWSQNSQENRLTPWSNDAVSDPSGEVIYIRDEETGEYWTPTPLPIRENGTYVIRHGQGYTQFAYSSRGISAELHMLVPLDASVKISRLRLKNVTAKTRRLSVTSYVEWVLGVNRAATAPHVFTARDPVSGMLIAKNPYSNEFGKRVAFSFMDGADSFTCDRKEFLGRNGNPARPDALGRSALGGRSGAGLDPCASFQKKIELAPGEECEVSLLLGQGNDREEARALALKYANSDYRRAACEAVTAYWDEVLGVIEIKTPDPAMNRMMNRWLLYQALSCRVWGRSAFYQSGGAFGFRDQLQDVMALVYAKPQIVRDQILNAAAHQFVEGDVLHWWHPQSGKGIRTHVSDDLLWLPFVTAYYVKITGDRSILNEVVPFIEAPLLDPQQESAYCLPTVSAEKGTLLEHCTKTLDRSLKMGRHGLPLMGSGDWNDGMNRVGHDGKGESVWLAWFLYGTLKEFIELLGEASTPRVTLYREQMKRLKEATQENAWDGDWYRRAYFDDGTPLGAALNQECQIDSIAQSWAVLSTAAERTRALQSMEAVDEKLIDRKAGIIKLLTPPFDKGVLDPGYIKGYVPGVRENGGQYTHAAIWTVMAFASLGDADRAWELCRLLNPIGHSSTKADLEIYKVEPYVVAADVYGEPPHVGRGGWTWYTGSASWMYRAVLESLLGFELKNNRLKINPCMPKDWSGFQILYKRGTTRYSIQVNHRKADLASEKGTIELDGVKLNSQEVLLVEDGKEHEIGVFC
ncbi:MAG: hypothetical protein A2048_05665 [Deltaproteobacteria bacterium GWA2_45_12]|nr:MAG: hypothetical protein A2048_05665 [Deltaproteobacteria bacterium GWA2_45_12]